MGFIAMARKVNKRGWYSRNGWHYYCQLQIDGPIRSTIHTCKIHAITFKLVRWWYGEQGLIDWLIDNHVKRA